MNNDFKGHYLEIADGLKRIAREKGAQSGFQASSYMGTSKVYLYIRAADVGEFAREWAHDHPALTGDEFSQLLDRLSLSSIHNEYAFLGVLLGRYPKLRKGMNPALLSGWLDHAEGWAEVDTICQSNFPADDMIAKWDIWEPLLVAFNHDPNVHKRRASLVLLNRALRESPDARFSDLSFANIIRLEPERDILITKAISWILRDLVKFHRGEVEAFLCEHAERLPKIAIRETRNKLNSGRKSGVERSL
jgi:3-methyladenine DNA glycosylase AlkD